MASKSFTYQETETIREALSKGMSYKEIAELLGRSVSSIANKAHKIKRKEETTKHSTLAILEKIPNREIIRYLYDIGYRIDNNELVLVQKVRVKLEDIVKGS